MQQQLKQHWSSTWDCQQNVRCLCNVTGIFLGGYDDDDDGGVHNKLLVMMMMMMHK